MKKYYKEEEIKKMLEERKEELENIEKMFNEDSTKAQKAIEEYISKSLETLYEVNAKQHISNIKLILASGNGPHIELDIGYEKLRIYYVGYWESSEEANLPISVYHTTTLLWEILKEKYLSRE